MESTKRSAKPVATKGRSPQANLRSKGARPPVYVTYVTFAEAATGEDAKRAAKCVSPELNAHRRRLLLEVSPALLAIQEDLRARADARADEVKAATANYTRDGATPLIVDHIEREAAENLSAALGMVNRALLGTAFSLHELMAAKVGLNAQRPDVFDLLTKLERKLGGTGRPPTLMGNTPATTAMRRLWLLVAYALGVVEYRAGDLVADELGFAARTMSKVLAAKNGGAS